MKMLTRKRSISSGAQSFKRVNSKEDILINESALEHPQKLEPSLRELSSRARLFSSARIKDISVALAEPKLREKALQAMTNAHCSESLVCYLAVCDWESLPEGESKNASMDGLFERFVVDGPESLCLSDTTRAKLLKFRHTALEEQYEGVEEIKKNALNDLRFNAVLLQALGSKGI